MMLSERLSKLIKDKAITPYEIFINTNIKQSTLSRILNGETTKPQNKTLKILANYLQTTIEYLKTGEGEILSEKKTPTGGCLECLKKDAEIKRLLYENIDLHKKLEAYREELSDRDQKIPSG